MEPTLPASWYGDPAIHERERQAIFRREWQVLGAAERVAEPGSYLAGDVAGWPVVVTRDNDGVLHGFHNVCRHRAGPLVTDGAGSCAGGLVCRYHGWANDLDGSLRRARDFGDDPGDLPLHPLATDEWQGLVFVDLDADAPPLGEALGGFADEVEAAGHDLAGLRLQSEASHVIECNWKVYAENYQEGYHIPLVHPRLNKEIDARAYTVDVHDRWCRHHAPARDGSPSAGLWLFRFPNLALNVYADGMNVERITPLGPRRTRVDYSYFFRLDAGGDAADEEAVRLSAEVLDEDRAICEAVQRNLDAGIYDTGVLSPRHEGGVEMVQRLVREALARP